jgi:formate dehydrogenase major subunit
MANIANAPSVCSPEIVETDDVCILWAMGITQHSMGSDSSTAISNLLLVTGNYMRTGTGAYPLRGHNNVQGASDHGAHPVALPGYQHVHDPEVRARFEAAWKVKLPTAQGLDNHQMIDAIHAGKLKAMYPQSTNSPAPESNKALPGKWPSLPWPAIPRSRNSIR